MVQLFSVDIWHEESECAKVGSTPDNALSDKLSLCNKYTLNDQDCCVKG